MLSVTLFPAAALWQLEIVYDPVTAGVYVYQTPLCELAWQVLTGSVPSVALELFTIAVVYGNGPAVGIAMAPAQISLAGGGASVVNVAPADHAPIPLLVLEQS